MMTKRKNNGIGDVLFQRALMIFPLIVLLILVGFIIKLTFSSMPSLKKFGLSFLWGTTWDPVFENFGALPFIFGTLVTSSVALMMAIPIGLGTAIYLFEYAPPNVRRIISMLVDLLAAVPSVIYGLWGIFVLVPLMRSTVQPFLGKYLGFLPFFQGANYGVGILTTSVILCIMILPFIISISREVLFAVPGIYKEAAYAVGATRWEAISTVILGYGKPGIIGGIILALGRAIGETMAVTMVIGNNVTMSSSLFSPGYSLASVIANEFNEATGKLYVSALIEMGLVLLLVSVTVNVLARLLIWSVTVKRSAGVGVPGM